MPAWSPPRSPTGSRSTSAERARRRAACRVAAARLQELARTAPGGKVTVAIFAEATPGDVRTPLAGRQIGAVDTGGVTNGPVAGFPEVVAAFALPLPSPEAARDILDGEFGQELRARLAAGNRKGLVHAERGLRTLTDSRRVMRSPADIRGLRIRVTESSSAPTPSAGLPPPPSPRPEPRRWRRCGGHHRRAGKPGGPRAFLAARRDRRGAWHRNITKHFTDQGAHALAR